MNERQRKRRGPIGWLAARTCRFWAGMALLFMLYVASIGPAELILRRQSVESGDATRRLYVDYDYWTPTYAPLLWIARHSDTCHAALSWYRELFPHKIHTRR